MKNKFISIFMLLLFFPIVLNAGSKDESIEICNKGVNDNNRLYSAIETGAGSDAHKITIYNFATDHGDDAYCIQPGKKAAGVGRCKEYYLQKDFINEDCKNSTDGFECGLAAILGYVNNEENSQEYNYDYVEVLTALRLWTAAKSPEAQSGDGLWRSDDFTSKTKIYTTTASKIQSDPSYNGYAFVNGQPVTDSYLTQPGLLHIIDQEPASEKQIDNAFGLFKMATEGIEVFVANVKAEKEEYTFDESGKAVVKLFTNFDVNTEEVEVTSEEVTIDSVEEIGECGENQYCYDVHVSIPLEDLKTCDEINATFNIKYKDKRDVLSHVKKYETNNTEYQTFIVYDEDANAGEKEIEVKFLCGENGEPSEDKCPYTGIKYEGSTECSGYEDTEEYKITDPELCTVMNMDKEKYKLEDIKYEYNSKLNTLCSVYCREKILFRFMGKKDVIAGRTFKYNVQGNTLTGDNKYITAVIATRECASKNIEYDNWKKDFEELNSKLLEAWNSYKLWEARVNKEIEHKENKTCSKCGCGTCKKDFGGRQQVGVDQNGFPIFNWVSNWQSVDDTCRQASTKTWTWYSWTNANYTKTNSNGNISSENVDGIDGSGEFSNYCYENCPNTTFSDCTYSEGKSAESKKNEYKGEYERYKSLREKMIEAIKDCNYLLENGVKKDILLYTFKAESSVEYEDYYTNLINIKGEQSVNNDVVTTKYCSGDNCTYKSICPTCESDASAGITEGISYDALVSWKCSGSETSAKCERETIDIPKSKAAYITTEKEEAYYQEIKFYTELFTGEVNTSGGTNYIPIMDKSGQSDFLYPLELDKENGEYEITEAFKNINEEFRRKLGLTLIDDLEYKCQINVCNETVLYENVCPEDPSPGCDSSLECCPGDTWISNPNHCPQPEPDNCNSQTTCCPGDMWPYNTNCPKPTDNITLGFIFRPIEMNDVFPNTRRIGRNWANSVSVINAIQNLSSDFWSTVTPQYSVTINPTQIKQIKGYNLNKNSLGGYLDYSLNCTDSNGTVNPSNCISSFLSDYLSSEGNAEKFDYNITNSKDKLGNSYVWEAPY